MRIKLLILFFGLFTYGANAQTSNNWLQYYIKTSEEINLKGSMLLYKTSKGEIFNPLNLAIIKHSEELSSFKEFTTAQKFKETFSVEEIDLSSEVFSEISTKIIYCSKNILSYQIRSAIIGRRDLGSPYYEYINIDLSNNSIINENDIIADNKKAEFKLFIKNYTNVHKKDVVQTHSDKISERIGNIYDPIDDFRKKSYNYKYVIINQPEPIKFICFHKSGIEFLVNVTDGNYKNYKLEHGDEYQYESSITIPYELLKPFLNTKSIVYEIYNVSNF